MFRPLAGVRVVDLTASLAGPYCTLILGSLGAEVVKVERPGTGDDTREWGPPFWNGQSATFLAMNANKRSLAVDVKSPSGLELVLRLVERSDVFVQNLRPGLAERLGLGAGLVRSRSPKLIYCSIGAFGHVGPLRSEPGYDPLMQAAAGIMSITGEHGRPPVRAGVSVVDQGTGMWAALAIVAALHQRQLDGRGRLLETSLYETALNWVPYQLVGYLATGEVPRAHGSGISIIAPYEAFAASDGWLMVAAGNDKLFASLCAELGLPELPEDRRFAANRDRVANREALAEALAARFQANTMAIWLDRLRRAGVPAAPVQDLGQVAEHDQTRALGILQPLPRADNPELRLVAPPVTVDDERVVLRTPPPGLGEHTDEILTELGLSPAAITRLRNSRTVA